VKSPYCENLKTECLSLWFAEDSLPDTLADKCRYCIVTFSFHLHGISKYACFSPEDGDGRFIQTLVLQHAMCQWVSSSQQQAQRLHLDSQTAGEIGTLLGYYAAYSDSSLPKFRNKISVPFSRVKKSKNEIPLYTV